MKSFHNFAKKHTCCLSIKNVVPFLSNDAYQFIRINFIVLIKILNNCEPDQNPDSLKLSICKCSIILNFVLVSLLYIIDSQVLYFTTCIYYFLDSVHRYKKRKTTFIFINIF